MSRRRLSGGLRQAALTSLTLLLAGGVALAAPGGPPPVAPAAGPAATALALAWPPSSGLLISEVLTGGASASDELIELYAAGAGDAALTGLEVAYVTATGGTVTRKASWTASLVLPPGGHLLLANAAGASAAMADLTYSGGLGATGRSVVLRAIGGAVVDAVGWGGATTNDFVEGTVAVAPAAGTSLERLPGGGAGNGVDTNDNSADFRFATPSPQEPKPSASPMPEVPIAAARRQRAARVTIVGVVTSGGTLWDADGRRFTLEDPTGALLVRVARRQRCSGRGRPATGARPGRLVPWRGAARGRGPAGAARRDGRPGPSGGRPRAAAGGSRVAPGADAGPGGQPAPVRPGLAGGRPAGRRQHARGERPGARGDPVVAAGRRCCGRSDGDRPPGVVRRCRRLADAGPRGPFDLDVAFPAGTGSALAGASDDSGTATPVDADPLSGRPGRPLPGGWCGSAASSSRGRATRSPSMTAPPRPVSCLAAPSAPRSRGRARRGAYVRRSGPARRRALAGGGRGRCRATRLGGLGEVVADVAAAPAGQPGLAAIGPLPASGAVASSGAAPAAVLVVAALALAALGAALGGAFLRR